MEAVLGRVSEHPWACSAVEVEDEAAGGGGGGKQGWSP